MNYTIGKKPTAPEERELSEETSAVPVSEKEIQSDEVTEMTAEETVKTATEEAAAEESVVKETPDPVTIEAEIAEILAEPVEEDVSEDANILSQEPAKLKSIAERKKVLYEDEKLRNKNATHYVNNDRRKSYWMRQKWKLQSVGSAKKLFTQLNNSYYLCNNGSDEGYVSNSASDDNSNIVITPCANSSELYEIKLANSNLYLTLEYNSSDQRYWAKWRSKSASNSSNQVWKFVEQPANLHNGVDTANILKETTIQALKSEDTEFVIRYYKLLGTLKGVTLKTLDITGESSSIPAIDNTILQLQEKGIDLDVENYLDYADTIPLTDSNLYGASLRTYEKKHYQNHNINIVTVYQNKGTKYEDFTEKHAKLDALSALMSAKTLNQPHGSVIYFAVDYNASNDELDRIKSYFDIIKRKIGGRYQIGVYGSGLVCSAIKPSYAQYSWLKHSTGHHGYGEYDDMTKYNIKQAETYSCNGIEVDDDIAVCSDYGQW